MSTSRQGGDSDRERVFGSSLVGVPVPKEGTVPIVPPAGAGASSSSSGLPSASSVATPAPAPVVACPTNAKSMFDNWGSGSFGVPRGCMLHMPATFNPSGQLLERLKVLQVWLHRGDLSDFVRRASEKLERPKIVIATSMNDIPSGLVCKVFGGTVISFDRFEDHVIHRTKLDVVRWDASPNKGLQIFISKAAAEEHPTGCAILESVIVAKGWTLLSKAKKAISAMIVTSRT
jgi:hypothetical protein